MTEKEKMLAGLGYRADDPELQADQARARSLLAGFNGAPPNNDPARMAILRELCAGIGEGVLVKPRFLCDYGFNIRIGPRTFVNYDAIFLDIAPIEIGADVQIATRVQLLTADHPLDPAERRTGIESGRPIRIGDNVWLGGGVIVCPGAEIGENTVVGAGAVVAGALPPGVLALGVPARPVRDIAG